MKKTEKLALPVEPEKRRPFKVTPRRMNVMGGRQIDSVSELLAMLEGPLHR